MSSPPPLPTHNPYAAPMARVDEAPVADLEYADRGTRLLAAIVDGLCFAVIGIVAAVVIPAVQPQGGEPDPVVAGLLGLLMLGGFLTIIIINCLWLHRYGQTIGKRVLKIKITRLDGSPCSLVRVIFARWLPVSLLGAIPLIGGLFSLTDVLFIFREDRRCIHDLIADTIVVKA